MHALGIPTTRTLAAVATGEVVFRETALPGAVLTRVAASHIRIGTFEYFATRGDAEAIKILADYCIERHYPEIKHSSQPYIALFNAVADAQASLVAKWLHVGFIHGVMNTDNMTISGETIDYGPCAFMDAYDPATVFSSIDHHGRYAFGNQPHIAQWNLARLAEAMLVMFPEGNETLKEQLQESIDGFHNMFVQYWLAGMRQKLGLSKAQDDDIVLITNLLEIMHTHADDYTNTMRSLHHVLQGQGMPEHYHEWTQRWQQRLAQESKPTQQTIALMRAKNPAFIPRNHNVEEAISAAVNENNFQPMEKLMEVLAKPFDDQPENAEFARPAAPSEQGYKTFCGT